MSGIIIEKLLEQRDFYLNTLKQLDFHLITDTSESEIKSIEKLKTNTIDQLKKVEQELAFILNDKS